MITVEQHELISEEEWYNRMVNDIRYRVVFINWADGITRIQDVETGEMYDVKAVKINNKLMLKLTKI
jgi:hypothetical protein